MIPLKNRLKSNLKNAKRIAVLGIGSELRGDDAAGIIVAKKLRRAIKDKRIRVFAGGSAPENITGEIRKFGPTHLVIVDAADFGAEPGAVDIIDIERAGGVSFSTHSMPIGVLVDYIKKSIGSEVIVIGIQPKDLGVGGKISAEVAKAMDKVLSLCSHLSD